MKWIAILLCIVVVSGSVASAEIQSFEEKRILMLFSYDPEFPTTEKVMSGLIAAFEGSVPRVDREYMDSKRHHEAAYQQAFYQLLRQKLRERPPYDLVITVDDNALDFAMLHREELFPESGIVFLGVNDIEKARRAAQLPNITGIVERAWFKETLALSEQLFPARKNIYFIVDHLTSGQADLKRIRDLEQEFSQFTFHYLLLTELSWFELQQQLAQLGEEDAVSLLSAYEDKDKQQKSFRASVELILNSTQVPVFHYWEHGVEEGVLGGYVVSHAEQGRQAGFMARRVFLGSSVDQIDMMDRSPNLPVFNAVQLKRFDVPRQSLPNNAIIAFEQPQVWHFYWRETLFAVGLISLLMVFIIYLVQRNIKMRLLSRQLVEQSRFLRLLMDTLPDLVWIKDAEGKYLACNRRFATLYGTTEKELLNKTDYDFTTRELADFFREKDLAAVRKKGLSVNEEKVPFADGHVEVLETIKTPIFDDAKNLIGVLGVGRDITERKQTEMDVRAKEKKYRVLFEKIRQGVVVYDHQCAIVDANPTAEHILGRDKCMLVGQQVLPEQWLQDGQVSGLETHTDHLLAYMLKQVEPQSHVLLSGELEQQKVWLSLDLVPLVDEESATVTGVFISFTDISKQKQANASLRLAASVFENTLEGVMITDAKANIIEVNASFTRVTGYSRDQVIGKTPTLLKSGLQSQTFYKELWSTLLEKGFWSGELYNKRADGTLFPIWQTISAVTDSQGTLSHYVAVFSDISEMKNSQREIYNLAFHDPLTNLPNRRLLIERLEQEIKRAERSLNGFTLMFLDLDNFKNVNETLGHTIGDQCLRQVAANLTYHLRNKDTVARIGGDEFVILFDDCGQRENAIELANKVLKATLRPILVNGDMMTVTASLGVCCYPEDGTTPDALLRNADIAMYSAKRKGRNNFQFYHAELSGDLVDRVSIETELRSAIERHELYLVYQPQYHLATNQLVGVEALIRWESPKLGFVSPDRMIPIAEETGMIKDIGYWVLETAARQARRWLNEGIDVGKLAVNIAGQQIVHADLPRQVQDLLDEYQLEPKHLALEVTETFVMKNELASLEPLIMLKKMGVELAIDDFGTGYSSLSYLKKLPVNKLKIDKSFVRDIPADPDDIAITKTILALGHNLGLKVIAEGVETQEQAEFLLQQGCDEVQGYYYAKPMRAEQLVEQIRQGEPH